MGGGAFWYVHHQEAKMAAAALPPPVAKSSPPTSLDLITVTPIAKTEAAPKARLAPTPAADEPSEPKAGNEGRAEGRRKTESKVAKRTHRTEDRDARRAAEGRGEGRGAESEPAKPAAAPLKPAAGGAVDAVLQQQPSGAIPEALRRSKAARMPHSGPAITREA